MKKLLATVLMCVMMVPAFANTDTTAPCPKGAAHCACPKHCHCVKDGKKCDDAKCDCKKGDKS